MQSIQDVILLLLLLGGLQGLILATVLITIKSESKLANRILASIVLLFSFNILFHTVFHTDQKLNFIAIDTMGDHLHSYFEPLYLFYSFAFLFGPLFYFYYKAITYPKFYFKKIDLLHFLPAALCLLIVLVLFWSGSIDPNEGDSKKELYWVSWLIFLQAFTYILSVVHSFYKNRKADLSGTRSSVSNWLVLFMICFGLIWIVAIFVQINSTGTEDWNFVWLLAAVFIYTTGYMGLYQPRIFAHSGSKKNENGEI